MEDLIFEIKLELFSIGIIIILDETISLLNVRVTNIKINGEYEPEQRISYKKVAKVVASTTKNIKMSNQKHH